MARLRGKSVLVYVDLSTTLKYGFRTNEALHIRVKTDLGQTTYAGAAAVFFGANSPKPAKASKEIATGTQSSFCSTDKINDLKKAGWTVTRKGNRRGVKTSGKTRTVYVDMPGGWRYAWNITQEEASLGAELGFTQATGGEASSLIWGVNYPKPPRARKVDEDGSSVSTFIFLPKEDPQFY